MSQRCPYPKCTRFHGFGAVACRDHTEILSHALRKKIAQLSIQWEIPDSLRKLAAAEMMEHHARQVVRPEAAAAEAAERARLLEMNR